MLQYTEVSKGRKIITLKQRWKVWGEGGDSKCYHGTGLTVIYLYLAYFVI